MREDPPRRFCVLLTDFPLGDPYVGVVQGVLLSGLPDARIVDLAHGQEGSEVALGIAEGDAVREVTITRRTLE